MRLGDAPLYFIENRGQAGTAATHYVQGRNRSIYFTSEGVTFVLAGAPERSHERLASPYTPAAPVPSSEAAPQRWAVKLAFIGARAAVLPEGQAPTSAVVSYFKGPREQWKQGLATYSRLVYPDLWPGIDLVYSGTANRLEHTFLVKPGADPGQIKLAYQARARSGRRRADGSRWSRP